MYKTCCVQVFLPEKSTLALHISRNAHNTFESYQASFSTVLNGNGTIFTALNFPTLLRCSFSSLNWKQAMYTLLVGMLDTSIQNSRYKCLGIDKDMTWLKEVICPIKFLAWPVLVLVFNPLS
jgi:hypothetical protein